MWVAKNLETGLPLPWQGFRVTPPQTVTVTGSKIKGNKLGGRRRPSAPCRIQYHVYSLEACSFTILNPCHMNAGLIYPVNSMQMFHDTAVNWNNMYLVHTDHIQGEGGKSGQEAKGSRLLSYCALQSCQWSLNTQQMAPSPEAGVECSPLLSLQEHSYFHHQALQLLCT